MVQTGTLENGKLPLVVAFDLDATLWYPEMYMLDGPPFKADRSAGVVFDRAKEEIKLLGDTRAILRSLANDERWGDTQVAYASRTEYPDWADRCLRLFELGDGLDMHSAASIHEIYPGSKRTHFRSIHQRSGVAFEDMLFFDDCTWNVKDVSSLGVTCVHCPEGLTRSVWEEGLRLFAQRQAKREKMAGFGSRNKR